jgi:GAF domain-containing protein
MSPRADAPKPDDGEPQGGELHAAVAAGVFTADEQYRSLLRSIVEVARAIFGAKASSIFLLDEETDELVFEAVAGEGSDVLVGRRLPSSTGIAGWVLVTRQPLVLEDVGGDPRFARDVAEGTGYVPNGLMAVPLLHDEEALGVLQVLDRPQRARFSLTEMDLLGQFGNQAAVALSLLRNARRAKAVLDGGEPELSAVARLAVALDSLEGERREAGVRLLAELERILAP